MRTIIAGSRTITDPAIVRKAIRQSRFQITRVISGGCRGVDKLAEGWALENQVPVTVVKPDWDELGKAAGPVRNAEMADIADALIAIRAPGISKGTDSMIRIAQGRGLKVFVYHLPGQ